MYTHKINSSLQEHQNFLAQNRKDPITGDAISEGDEVVFCASCKSVFLKDTWEYLNGRHCEQSETLIDFPLSSVILDLAKEDIFFYTFIFEEDGNIPALYASEWKVKDRELSEYHRLFNGAPVVFVVIVGFLVASIIGFINQNGFTIIGGIIILVLALFSKNLHNSIHGEKLDTIHRKFTNNVFFISTTGIGFSTNYGIKEYTLNANYIKSLEFNFIEKEFQSIGKCIIKYKQGKRTKFYVRNVFKEKTLRRFLRALDKLNEKHAVPIHIKVSKSVDYKTAADFINSNQSKITISIQ